MNQDLVSLSTQFFTFLSERERRGGIDSEIAAKFRNHRMNRHTDNDYYDILLNEGRAMITYLPAARYERLDGDANPFTARNLRMSGRAGTVAQRVTGITDGRALAEFTEALAGFLSRAETSHETLLYRGGDIVDIYDSDSLCECGEPFYSCMTDAGSWRLALYMENAEIAVVRCGECGGVRARSIVWKGDDGIRWYDRVYAYSTKDRELLTNALEGRGIHEINPYAELIVETDSSYENVPYLDSVEYCYYCGVIRKVIGSHPCPGEAGNMCGDEYEPWAPSSKPVPIEELDMQSVDTSRTHCACGSKHTRTEVCDGIMSCPIHGGQWCRYAGPPEGNVAPCGCAICECGIIGCRRIMVCDACGDSWCPNVSFVCPRCPYCTRCGTSYTGERCPRETTCEHCGEVKCAGIACRNSAYCSRCRSSYCGTRCPNRSNHCASCDEWYHEGEECWKCDTCEKCGARYDVANLPWMYRTSCLMCEEMREPGWFAHWRYNPIAPGANGLSYAVYTGRGWQ